MSEEKEVISLDDTEVVSEDEDGNKRVEMEALSKSGGNEDATDGLRDEVNASILIAISHSRTTVGIDDRRLHKSTLSGRRHERYRRRSG